MTRLLMIKTGALGDVLRTTSILPGLAERHPDLHVTWVTAHAAAPLLEHHPLVQRVEGVSPEDIHELALVAGRLVGRPWDRVLSLDDEPGPAGLASTVLSPGDERLCGAYVDGGRVIYTDDAAGWFDMGLVSRLGKERADELKKRNRRSHPALLAELAGVRPGRPALHLSDAARAFGRAFAERWELDVRRPVVGLNTGAGGRWASKELSVERTVELARQVAAHRDGGVTFLVLGGPDETRRNRAILEGLRGLESRLAAIDAGTDNGLLEFAALVGLVDVLVASDSLAMHVALCLERRVVCFFAPTSGAEIELWGLGQRVLSTAPDYCSYRPDADNSSITPERLCGAVLEELPR